MRPISESDFVIETSGELDSPPASGVREFLIMRGARRLTTIVHPLNPEAMGMHLIERFDGATGRVTRRRLRLPSRPPLTYPLDLLVPPLAPRADAYIGFNNLAAARALAARAAGRVRDVAYWAVDFVPDRFGPGAPLTRAYDALDAWVCRNVDARFEVSEVALNERNARHGIDAQGHVAPMGAWIERVPHTQPDGHAARRVVWIGHMVERQGVGCLLEALGLLARRGVEFEAELAGRGPLEEKLRATARELGIADRVRFLGYVADHKELEAALARASVATAPYATDVESFTQYADPAKLKAYLAAGLPIVTTPVPPNATEVAEHGGGEVVAFARDALADAIERALADPAAWSRRREAALTLASEYDWGRIVARSLAVLGYGD